MFGAELKPGTVKVTAEKNKGHSPEFWADRAADRICGISKDAPDHVRQQAEAFKEKVREEILRSILGALKSDRQTMAGELRESGYSTVAEQVLRFRIRS